MLVCILHHGNDEGFNWNLLYQFFPGDAKTEFCCISSALEMPVLWESTATKAFCLDFLVLVFQELPYQGQEHIGMLKLCFLHKKLSIPTIGVQMKNWSGSHLLLQHKRTDEAWETIAADLFHCLQKKQLISSCITWRARSDGRKQSHVSISWHMQRCN